MKISELFESTVPFKCTLVIDIAVQLATSDLKSIKFPYKMIYSAFEDVLGTTVCFRVDTKYNKAKIDETIRIVNEHFNIPKILVTLEINSLPPFLIENENGYVILNSAIKNRDHTPEIINNYEVSDDKTVSLQNIDKLIKCKQLNILFPDAIKSNVLGLMSPNIKKFSFYIANNKDTREWTDIITKQKKNGNDIFECKEELINAGYKDYAKL